MTRNVVPQTLLKLFPFPPPFSAYTLFSVWIGNSEHGETSVEPFDPGDPAA